MPAPIFFTHNLMLMLEDLLKKEGVDNETENKRREQRLKNLLAKSKVGNEELPEFLSTPKRPSQRTVKLSGGCAIICFPILRGARLCYHLKMVDLDQIKTIKEKIKTASVIAELGTLIGN